MIVRVTSHNFDCFAAKIRASGVLNAHEGKIRLRMRSAKPTSCWLLLQTQVTGMMLLFEMPGGCDLLSKCTMPTSLMNLWLVQVSKMVGVMCFSLQLCVATQLKDSPVCGALHFPTKVLIVGGSSALFLKKKTLPQSPNGCPEGAAYPDGGTQNRVGREGTEKDHQT